MKEEAKKSIQRLTGLKNHFVSFYREEKGALTKLLLDTYFYGTLETGKNHFALLGHAKTVPYLEELEEAYCTLRRYDFSEIETFSGEIFGPKTTLIYLPTADPYTKEIYPIQEILEKALEKNIPVHMDATASIGLHASNLKEEAISSMSFEMGAIGKTIGSVLLSKKVFSSSTYLGEDFLEEVVDSANLMKDSFETRLLSLAKKKRFLSKFLKEAHCGFSEIRSLPNALSGRFEHIYGEALAFRIRRKGNFLEYHPKDPQKVAIQLAPNLSQEELENRANILLKEMQALRKIAGKR